MIPHKNNTMELIADIKDSFGFLSMGDGCYLILGVGVGGGWGAGWGWVGWVGGEGVLGQISDH